MREVVVVPGLVLTEEMFGAAEVGLSTHASGLVTPTWEWFTNPANWTLVPDPQCFGYKAELVVLRSPERTVKINLWMGPDLRSGEAPKPHNHPWEWFNAHILMAGYREVRYEPAPTGGWPDSAICEHYVGGMNRVERTTFHEVVEIADPGRTLTLMDCGPGVQGDWGYVDPHSGDFVPNRPDPEFVNRLRQLNPRMR